MKQNTAVMLNTDKLGGAERSLLLQLGMVKNTEMTFFIPKLSSESGSTELKQMITEKQLGRIVEFSFPEQIYSLSRSRSLFSIKAFKEAMSFFFGASPLAQLKEYDTVYLNGNKIAFLYFMSNLKSSFKAKVIWHLRDYYHSSALTDFVWEILTGIKRPEMEIVCNSHSVRESLKATPLARFPASVIYNPSGELKSDERIRSIETLGFVSMMAPWKGIHEILFFAWMYERELKELGVKSIKIYGDNLYKTSGEHVHYKEQLQRISKKFHSDLISFEGMKRPEEIFSQIDCLIHYSLSPEPFGRVLIEAYEAGVPVITTGLGGAGEILDHGRNGFKVCTYDRRDLFEKVRSLSVSNILRMNFVSRSKIKSAEIQKDISEGMNRVLALKDVS